MPQHSIKFFILFSLTLYRSIELFISSIEPFVLLLLMAQRSIKFFIVFALMLYRSLEFLRMAHQYLLFDCCC